MQALDSHKMQSVLHAVPAELPGVTEGTRSVVQRGGWLQRTGEAGGAGAGGCWGEGGAHGPAAVWPAPSAASDSPASSAADCLQLSAAEAPPAGPATGHWDRNLSFR